MPRSPIARSLQLGLLLALLSGCQTGPPPQPLPVISPLPAPPTASTAAPTPPPPSANWQPASPGEIRLVVATEPLPHLAASPSTGAQRELMPAPIQPAQPTLSLTLFDAVEMGLAQNPDLVALRAAEGVSEGALGVAETYPFNPWVQIQATPIQQSALSNSGPVSYYVLLMQQLQLAHQRAHRTDAAAAALNSVRWNYVQAKLVNAAQTQRLYSTALYQREIAGLARAQADLTSQLWAISERQLAAGQIAGADVAILKLDRISTSRQAALADANYQTALLDLRRQLGMPLAVPLQLVGRLTDWRWQEITDQAPRWANLVETEIPLTSDRSWLASSLASGRPDVSAACADVEAARANLDLARANRVPDLIIGPYYLQSDEPKHFYGFRAQTDIPVLNTGLPLVRQRLAELTQRQAIWGQLLNRATLEAHAAIDRYDRALHVVSDTDTAVSEELPPELMRLEQQFKAGEVDMLRVVTARNSFFQARRAALDTANELALASAALIAATGLPPETMLSPR